MDDTGRATFDIKLFRTPISEYRGAPFWAWTGRPERQVMEEQISEFRDMGFGGFFMHPRIGLDVEYLGEEFMRDIRFCCDTAKSNEMHAYLYDEDKWPSGFGGGRVTTDPDLASKYLLLSPVHYSGRVRRQAKGHTRLTDSGEVKLLKRFSLDLVDGRLKSYRELDEEETAECVWYLYEVLSDRLDWFNGARYANLIASGTAERFLNVTYESYRRELSDEFGKAVPAIFTDEPSVKRYETMEDSRNPGEVGFPFSDDVEGLYREKYKESFLSRAPEIIFNLSEGRTSQVRYRYFDIVSELFSTGYIRKIGEWCRRNAIAFTGHFQDENHTVLQAKACGDVMRAMAEMDIPGIDILVDRHEFFTLKQAQSVVHQFGKRGLSAELYGVTNWDFTPAEHKHQGDWVAALGVTLRVPHLSWMSMKGQMKRDFPASLNHCLPWYKQYGLLEDHFSRLNTVLTRGKPVVRVAVLNPVESAWMLLGPDNETLERREKLDNDLHRLCEWLLFDNIDFDLLNEALLTDTARIRSGKLCVGEMCYDAVIIPEIVTVRSSTLELIKDFTECSGKVIWIGTLPGYVDGEKSNEVQYNSGYVACRFDECEILEKLESLRTVSVSGTDNYIYQLRKDDDDQWLFIARGSQPQQPYDDLEIKINGYYTPELYDTMTGEVSIIDYEIENGYTIIRRRLYSEESLLLRLTIYTEQTQINRAVDNSENLETEFLTIPESMDYTLEEPNVMLLDEARFRIDGGEWNDREEILRIDDRVRQTLGYKLRTEGSLQPWCVTDRTKPHVIDLECTFYSDIETSGRIGFEFDGDEQIAFNGQPIHFGQSGWYVDRAIKLSNKVSIVKGMNVLSVSMKYGALSGLEAAYIVGEFGVTKGNSHEEPYMISSLPQKLKYGSVTEQGLAFYGGNVVYSCAVEVRKGAIHVKVNEYAGAMVEVDLDGRKQNVLAPERNIGFENVNPGEHIIRFKVFGNRMNTFGALHDNSGSRWCYGTMSYRTSGEAWTYGYTLRPFGLLRAPEICE